MGGALPILFPRLPPLAFALCRCAGVLVVGTLITLATEGLRIPILTRSEWGRLVLAAAAMGYLRFLAFEFFLLSVCSRLFSNQPRVFHAGGWHD